MQMEVAWQQVGHVWKKSEFSSPAKPMPALLPAKRPPFNKMAHRITRWDRLGAAIHVYGDKGEMPACMGPCQQDTRGCSGKTGRIPYLGIKGLRPLVAIRADSPPAVAVSPCGPGKLLASWERQRIIATQPIRVVITGFKS